MGERRGTKALELWCRRMTEGYPGVDVTNMTTSWRDGLAFCAMIHHFRPDLIEFDKLNKSDVYYNNDLAFRTAERHLGIPALLDASDMALYEVPDRLSILTYLSQFYQVFGSQDSPYRLSQKRASAVTEKSPISSKPTGPPAKMAHVVGVPKREPCSACGLPVFLAERLTIPSPNDGGTKRVYHRTCLRCARCKSQLTPGSFYETEVDGEYCCETCPDEEKLEALKNPALSKPEEKFTATSGPSRGSIADRLAFFENDNNKKLLQKSVSDEEKSQSLQQISETQKSVYKQNPALSKFMTNTLVDTPDSRDASPYRTKSTESSRRSSTSSSSSSDSEMLKDETNEPELEKIPDLPKSLPPSISPIADVVAKDPTPTSAGPSSFKSSIQLSLDSPAESTKPSKVSTISSITSLSSTKQIASDTFERIEAQNKEKSRDEIKLPNITPTKSIGEPLSSASIANSDLTDQTNVTKDKSDTDEKMRTIQTTTITTKAAAAVEAKEKDTSTTIPVSTITTSKSPTKFDEISQTNRSSMVRARLHQFEEISHNSPSSSISKSSNNDRSSISPRKETPTSIHLDSEKVSGETQPEIVGPAEIAKSVETEVPKDVTATTDSIPLVAESNIEDSSKSSIANLELNETEMETNAIPDPDVVNDADKVEEKFEQESQQVDKEPSSEKPNVSVTEEYPDDLNPFQSDDDDGEEVEERVEAENKSEKEKLNEKRKSLNPFDSSDDEVELKDDSPQKVKPPRPPPPKLKSTNPFGSEDDEEDDEESKKSIESTKRRPVPTPRSHLASSQNSTPEPTPRLSRQTYATPLSDSSEVYGSSSSLANQLNSLNSSTDELLRRGSLTRGSTHSVVSSTGSLSGGKYKKAKKAPPPPPKQDNATAKELFPTPSTDTLKVSPQPRKKRIAPAPPPVAETSSVSIKSVSFSPQETSSPVSDSPKTDDSKIVEEKLSDDEKLKDVVTTPTEPPHDDNDMKSTMRRISIDPQLLDDSFVAQSDASKSEDTVVYRRTIAPLIMENSLDEDDEVPQHHDRQLEKLKDNKEAKNRNRQSQITLPAEENDPLFNKSIHGKWKRRKGPAPALPVPPKKVLQMLPLQEIRHELEIIEVQQQGLEKQGVILEKMIRERCEGVESGNTSGGGAEESAAKEDETGKSGGVTNSKEVEDLIMQLFELVNEKNELFRRQAELMYLRRQHRLEQEQADLEYEIRVLMAQPERNKTDSDKAREEALIGRMVEVVQLRNEVIECLEMDRLREAEEDMSIKQRLEMHAAKRDEELCQQTPTKLSKKEKKRLKEAKKLGKSKKLDADKDADESELAATALEKKEKKKKKNILTSVIPFNK